MAISTLFSNHRDTTALNNAADAVQKTAPAQPAQKLHPSRQAMEDEFRRRIKEQKNGSSDPLKS